jgi:hypothetical protein
MRPPSKIDLLAILLSAAAFLICFQIAANVFDNMPHLEDELAYVWQAKAIAEGGSITVPSPPCPKCFLVPFVVDYQVQRFGKYPLGWPVMLSIGEKFGLRDFVNPLLAGWSIWLVYRLGKKLFDEKTAILAAFLTTVSPFFLMNAGSLLGHIWSLFLVLAFSLAWYDTFDAEATIPKWLTILTAGLSLGLLALTRQLTAVAILIPFAIHGLYLLFKGTPSQRKALIIIAGITAFAASLHFLWQYAVTGDPLQSPYTLWWPYDKIGFGPDIGINKYGHNILYAWYNTKFSLKVGSTDLFGWPRLSWIFLPSGLWAVIKSKNIRAGMIASTVLTLISAYLLYWIGSWLFGPRYYFECIFALSLLSAAGIRFAAGTLFIEKSAIDRSRWDKTRFVFVMTLLGILTAGNLVFYTPQRIGNMKGLYHAEAKYQQPFLTKEAQALAPALIIVHPHEDWMNYGTLLDLSSPYHDTPFVFIYDRGEEMNQPVLDYFPERSVFHYYTSLPGKFYTAPLNTRKIEQ